MTHLATADTDPEFAPPADRALSRGGPPRSHTSPATLRTARRALRLPEARFDARPLRDRPSTGSRRSEPTPAEDGLEPILSWTSEIALAKLLRAGQSTGYGRRFVAERDTWIGIVPVGYGDGLAQRT